MKKKVEKQKSITPLSSNVKEALLKKALGYEVTEVVEEYGIVGDELQLIKKKVNTKAYPPDLEAIELALSDESPKESDYAMYTDEELLDEKHNLVLLFKKLKEGKDESS